MQHRNAFSLVELSIVLVILGLLVGGVLTGQSLIRAAELRSIGTQFQQFQTATQTFRDRFFAIPGDMRNAEDFWGSATCPGTAGVGTETCNGNGDGIIAVGAADEYSENFTFWQHLANAGLIEGSFTGLAGPSGATHTIADENVPRARLANGAWYARYVGPTNTGNGSTLAGDYGNNMFMGTITTGTWPSQRILSTEEMWNLDTKLDDALPARGRLITFWWDGCGTGTSQSDFDAEYDLSIDGAQCTPIFRQLF